MAALTWRNVDAPDFRGTLNGLAQSQQMLNDALGSASNVLGSIDADKSNAVNRQIQMKALQYQDPAAYEAALRSGEIVAGADPTRVDEKTLTGLDNRSNTLLNRNIAQYAQGRTVKNDTALDAAAPAQAAMAAAYASGDPRQIAAANAQYGPALAAAGLSGEQVASQYKTNQGLEQNALGIDSKRFTNDTTQLDYAETRQAQDLYTDIRRRSAEGADALDIVESMNVSPGVRTKLNSLLSGSYGDLYAPLGQGASAGAGGNTPSTGAGGAGKGSGSAFTKAITYPETANYVTSILSKSGPVTGTNEEKAAKLLPFLIQQESGGRDDATSSKGAQGRTQVMPKTGANPGYGVKPMANQTPEEYERFGKDYLLAMLDLYGGDEEKALAAYNGGPGKVDEWVSSIPKGAVDTALSETANRYMQNTGKGGASNRLALNVSSDANSSEAARSLTSENGAFAGANAGRVADAIKRVMNDGDVNAAQAAEILASSPQEAGFWTDVGGFIGGRNQTRNLGGDIRIDDDAVQAQIESHRNGAAQQMQRAQQFTAEQSAALQSANQRFNEAQIKYQAALKQPRLAGSMPRLRKQLEDAQASLEYQLSLQRSTPALQARRPAKPENEPVSKKTVPDTGFTSASGYQQRGPSNRELLLR